MSEAALAIVDTGENEKPDALMQRAKLVAEVCRTAVLRLAIEIDGKKYLPVEAWCTIATAYGCVPSIREVVEEDRGIRAVAELRRMNGSVVAAAEGFCGLDEPRWATQPLFARRAMSQTRAISRVCRTAFAFVVTLMDSNLSTTPYDEITRGDDKRASSQTTVTGTVTSLVAVKAPPERSKGTEVRFGPSKGKFLPDLNSDELQWVLNAARRADGAKDPKWGEKNREWLERVETEAARRNA